MEWGELNSLAMFTVFIIMFVIRVALFLNEIIKCDLFLSLSLSLSKTLFFFIRVAYFNHAANLLKYFDKLLKKKKKKSDFKPFNWLY